MDIKSLEPSDELLSELQERLQRLEGRRDLPKNLLVALSSTENDPAAPLLLQSCLHNRHISSYFPPNAFIYPQPITGETAYARTRRQEKLLEDLELLGFEQWSNLGKREEFDRLTERAIRSRHDVSSPPNPLHFYCSETLNEDDQASWAAARQLLRMRARGATIQKNKPELKYYYVSDEAQTKDFNDNQDKNHEDFHIEHIKPNFQTDKNLKWSISGEHRPLYKVIQHHGLHAEIANNKSEHKISYEFFDSKDNGESHR